MYPHILLRNRQTRSFHPVICWSGSSVHEPRYQAWLPLTDIIHQQKRSKHDGSREKWINLSMCLSTSLSHQSSMRQESAVWLKPSNTTAWGNFFYRDVAGIDGTVGIRKQATNICRVVQWHSLNSKLISSWKKKTLILLCHRLKPRRQWNPPVGETLCHVGTVELFTWPCVCI